MYNSDINSGDRLGCRVPACLPPVWHAPSVYSVFSSSHDMRALEHVREEVFLYCCCQACPLFFSDLSLIPFFSLCLSWLYDPCASTRVNRLLQRHVCSCNCACKSQHASWEVRPPTDKRRCRLEALLFDYLFFYVPLDCIKYNHLCPVLLFHLFSFWMPHQNHAFLITS